MVVGDAVLCHRCTQNDDEHVESSGKSFCVCEVQVSLMSTFVVSTTTLIRPWQPMLPPLQFGQSRVTKVLHVPSFYPVLIPDVVIRRGSNNYSTSTSRRATKVFHAPSCLPCYPH